MIRCNNKAQITGILKCKLNVVEFVPNPENSSDLREFFAPSAEHFGREDVDFEKLCKLQRWPLTWKIQPKRFGHRIHVELCLSRLQRPGKMMNLDALNLPFSRGVKAIALGNESL